MRQIVEVAEMVAIGVLCTASAPVFAVHWIVMQWRRP